MTSANPPRYVPPRRHQTSPWRHLSNLLLGTAVLGVTAAAGTLVGLAISFRDLPDIYSLRGYVPTQTTEILDIQGRPIAFIHGEANREVVPLDGISPYLKLAVLGIEDSHFYSHMGINPVRITRAALGVFEGGLGSAGGGSTLTMQLIKNLFLTPEQAISRKVAEVVLAVRLEQVFTKDEILEMYLNQVYWGHNLYGIQTAAESYFSKSADQLSLAEAAMLAGMLQAPEALSPFRNLEGAQRRQRVVLQRLVELGWVSEAEAEAARNEELTLGRITSFQSNAPAITDAIEAELVEEFGRDALLKAGLRVQTTIDLDLQRRAQEIADSTIGALANVNADQMAIAAVDPRTGFIRVLVGGLNAERGQFNRATQAHRQPGSAFKPYVYYAALASGRYWPDSILEDTPITYPDGRGGYSPRNYDGSFMGAISFRQSLELSRNVTTVKMADDVGIRNVIDAAHAAGIVTDLEPNLALSLGAADLTPLEMAASYAAFANGGLRVEPTLIMQVVDRRGRVLRSAEPDLERTLDPWAVAHLNQILVGVTTSGTGTAALMSDGRPVAGKTGTTSDFRDAWFVGYVPQLSAAVWIGNDDNSPMAWGTTGGGMVAGIWRQFMEMALAGEPVETFIEPWRLTPPQPRNNLSPELR